MLNVGQLQQLSLQAKSDCINAYNRIGIFDAKTEADLVAKATANYTACKALYDTIEAALAAGIKASGVIK